MTLQQAILILKHHNYWRRGNTAVFGHTEKEIGEAIDVVIAELSAHEGNCPLCGGKMEYKFTLHYFKCIECKETYTN